MLNDYEANREIRERVLKIFLDEEQSREYAKAIFNQLAANVPWIKELFERDSEEAEFFLKSLLDEVLHGIEIIFAYSESPIEKIFFNTVNMLASANSYPLRFQKPTQFKPDDIKKYAERQARANLLIDWYIQNYGDDIDEFEKWLDEIDEYEDTFKNDIYSRFFDRAFSKSYNIFIQADLVDVIPNTSFPYRVDAFITSSDMKYKLVVECDGFQFHKEKPIFTRDRQKDRFLRAKGFDILRFSGSEIHADPRECGRQLINYILEQQ